MADAEVVRAAERHVAARPNAGILRRAMFWHLVLRALRLRRQRVAVVFGALAVGAAIVTAMAAVYFDINAKMSRELRSFGANFYVGPGGTGRLQEVDYDAVLAAAPGGLVVGASPYLYGMARTEKEKVVMLGLSFASLRQLVPYWQVSGDWIGVDFDERSAMLGRQLAERLELQPGGTLTLVNGNKRKALRVRGLIEAGDATDNMLVVTLGLAQQWLDAPGQISHALFSLDSSRGQVDEFAARLRAAQPQLDVRPILKVAASEGQVLDKIKGLMGLVSVVILVLSTLCVNTTLIAMVGERAREFALQKALGARDRDLLAQILAETGLTALAATVVGCALGYLLAQALGHAVFAASIDLRWPVLPLAIVSLSLVALAAAVAPLRRITRIQPAAVLKGE
ncbi:MAG: ABC transporter permease [Propionivibrio sp.]